MTQIDAPAILDVLNEDEAGAWGPPIPFGPDGWAFLHLDRIRAVVVTCDLHDDDAAQWVHASMTGDGRVPSYEELLLLHRAVFAGRWAYQVFAPPEERVDVLPHQLHLFGRLDGEPALPDFTRGTGSI